MSESVLQQAMREAIALARKGRFVVAPNPCVGAVLVRGGEVVARGWHTRYGEAHAEVEVLRDARARGVNPAECTLVVTLEPCRHHGKTPPCTEAVRSAGIRHVVVGAMDPDPQAGGGAEALRAAGITVETGLLEQECLDLIADFITWQTTPLPYTILKLAATLDGRIATRSGHSKWISCEKARALVHSFRRHMGAILVGGKTFYQDNPHLTCRPADGDEPVVRQPLAVVVTSRIPGDTGSNLLMKRPHEAMFWTTAASAASPRAEIMRAAGASVLGLAAMSGGRNANLRADLNLAEGLAALRSEYGCLHVLCEGGGRLGLSLLERGLVGELHLHLSPRILADNEAIPLFDGLCPDHIDGGLGLRILDTAVCGDDLIVALRPKNAPDIPVKA